MNRVYHPWDDDAHRILCITVHEIYSAVITFPVSGGCRTTKLG